jgi:RND family efflux transporter MFP subunit
MNKPTRFSRPVIALIAIGMVVIAAFLLRRAPSEEEAETVVAAKTITVEAKDFEITLPVLGTVEPNPAHAAQVSAPDASRVQKIYVALGDHVAAGDPLVQLDSSVWTAKRKEAQTALSTAQKAFERAKKLLSEGISPRKDVESAEAELAGARARLEEARRVERLGTLRAPLNGVVVAVNAALAQPVDAAQTLVQVLDPVGLEILFHLSAQDAGRIVPGDDVELSSADGAQPIGTGTIKAVSAAVDTTTGTVDVRATIDAPGRPLIAHETVSGRIVLEARPNAVVLPAEALVPEGNAMHVFVVDPEGVAHSRTVTVGSRSEEEAEILAGIQPGDVVVTEGAYGVTDGAKIGTDHGE